jgi:small ligand-binding sensory domain FIST
MKCAAALSTLSSTGSAVREAVDRLAARLDGQPADLVATFVSSHHAQGLERLAAEVRERGIGRHVLGCTGESIVGEDREVEGRPAVSVWALAARGMTLTPLRWSGEPDLDIELPSAGAQSPADRRLLLLLGDPYSFPAEAWLRRVQELAPSLRTVGGMASSGQAPGRNVLVLDGAAHNDGAVAMLIDAPHTIRTIVSQGCRPIGRPMIVTRAERNVIRELGRRPAVEAFREVYEGLDEAEQELVQSGLHIGRVINEYQESFGRGDFLVRNVMGADDGGGIAITDHVRVGQTVQFHVRDATTADEDLRTLLGGRSPARAVLGALLFTCNGRGSRLFDEPDHDVSVLRDECGPVPVAGFFAMGEVGPIGDQNFVHGFTASIALFEHNSRSAF